MQTMTDGMSHEERVDALRWDFQERVSKYSAALWTITESEAADLLRGCSVSVLLGAFSKTGQIVKHISLDFSLLLPDVTAIADEVDGQLTQSIGGYMELVKARADA